MKFIFTIIFVALTFASFANISDTIKLYNPNANAKNDIDSIVRLTKKNGKHTLLMIGGNWCSWCIKFNKFVKKDSQLDSALNTNFELYHMNHSKENKNTELLAKYGFPQRFGFPVFIVLDAKGNRIHTQNSAYLEEEKGYSKAKVLEFFTQWNAKALKAENYTD